MVRCHYKNMERGKPHIVIGCAGLVLILLTLCACSKKGQVNSLEGISDVSYLPVLINTLKDNNLDTRCKAANAIGKIGSEAVDAVPALIEALKHNHGDVRGCAVKALGEIGPQATEAIGPLYQVAFGRDVRLCKMAFEAIEKIAPSEDEKVAGITKSISDSDPIVRREAAKMLYTIDADIQSAYPALKKALDDPDQEVRQYASATLKKIDKESGDTEKTVFLLKNILTRKDETILAKREAAEKLGAMGEKAAKAIPALVKAFLSNDNWSPHYIQVRYTALRALGQIGPKAGMAATFIIKKMKDVDYQMRIEAMRAVGLIGAKPNKAVPILIELLDSKATTHKKEAIIALGRFGPKAKAAVYKLSPFLTDPKGKDEFRIEAAIALGNIGPDALAAVPSLLTVVTRDNKNLRSEAVTALGKIGLDTFRPVLPAVINALHDDAPEVRLSAARALSHYDIPNNDVLEGLQKLACEDKNLQIRRTAAQIVAKLTSADQ